MFNIWNHQERQIKSTVRVRLAPVSVVITKKANSRADVGEDVGKRDTHALLAGAQTHADILEVKLRLLKIIKTLNRLIIWPNYPTLDTCLEDSIFYSRNSSSVIGTAALFTNSQEIESASVSMSRWTDPETLVHIHSGLSLSWREKGNHKKKIG